MAGKAYITPNVLKWARESARMSEEISASKVSVTIDKLQEWEADKKAILKLKQKLNSGGPNPYLLRLNKNSRLFTQVVLDALRGGFVQPTQASLLLGTPVNNFHKLEAQIYR